METRPSSLVLEPQLAEATGYSRPADIERWLKKNGVRYFRGKANTLFTTLDALNNALEGERAMQFGEVEFG